MSRARNNAVEVQPHRVVASWPTDGERPLVSYQHHVGQRRGAHAGWHRRERNRRADSGDLGWHQLAPAHRGESTAAVLPAVLPGPGWPRVLRGRGSAIALSRRDGKRQLDGRSGADLSLARLRLSGDV